MKRRLRFLMLVLLSLSLAIGSVSCHKNASVKNRRDYKRERRHDDKNRDKDKSKIDDAWKTLTIKLSRHDNKALYEELRSWLGTPYQYAGSKKGEGADCSGMVMNVYQTVYKKKIERNSAMIFENNCKRISRDELREGDLVFFITGKSGRISHVGIYLKEGKFVHASSSRGVIVSDLDEKYWKEHYATAGRVM